jgi:hypothetical protein
LNLNAAASAAAERATGLAKPLEKADDSLAVGDCMVARAW